MTIRRNRQEDFTADGDTHDVGEKGAEQESEGGWAEITEDLQDNQVEETRLVGHTESFPTTSETETEGGQWDNHDQDQGQDHAGREGFTGFVELP
jgi:hypothetical protein